MLALGGGGRGGAVAGHELLQPAAVHLGTEYRYNNNNIDNSSSYTVKTHSNILIAAGLQTFN